jgi:hypothetical protein
MKSKGMASVIPFFISIESIFNSRYRVINFVKFDIHVKERNSFLEIKTAIELIMWSGELKKLKSAIQEENGKINYQLNLWDSTSKETSHYDLNKIIGQEILIEFEGEIICASCAKKTKKTYMDGLCYKCFQNAPQASPCVLRPELCRAHLGEGRDPGWEEKNHNQPHIVYLAASDVVKVGVTRKTQLPTRWIDQGANLAIVLAETPNRFIAGQIEVALKQEFTDKTNWRKMLTNSVDESIDLETTKWELEEVLPSDISDYITESDEVLSLNYPVIQYPEKVKSLSLDKVPMIQERLMGIKGQYFIFESGNVMNVRKHTGYTIKLSTKN